MLVGTVHVGRAKWSWSETLPTVDALESAYRLVEPPQDALFDSAQIGYVSSVDLLIEAPGVQHSVVAYLWVPEDGPAELLTEQAIHTAIPGRAGGRKPAHGPMDLPDNVRTIAFPAAVVAGTDPGSEDTGLPTELPVPGAREVQ